MEIWFDWVSLAGIEGRKSVVARRKGDSLDEAFSVQ